VNADESDQFRKNVAEAYQAATGHRPDIYVCEASQGVGIAEPAQMGNSIQRA
jgi:galactokinase